MHDHGMADQDFTVTTSEMRYDEAGDIEDIIMMADEGDESQNMYRMVNKEYYCYVCQLKLKKLCSVKDLIDMGLTCERCGQGFCEILDKDTVDYKGIVQIGLGQNPRQREEEKKQTVEVGEVSMIDRLQQHNNSGIREADADMNDDRFRPPRA